MQSLSCTQFSFSIFIDRDRLTTEIDEETDRSSMESFLLAMLSKERNARRRDRSVSKSRKAGLRILRTPITEPPTGNRFFLYRYRLLDIAFLACKIALRRRVSNRVFESQRRVYRRKQPNVEMITDEKYKRARFYKRERETDIFRYY